MIRYQMPANTFRLAVTAVFALVLLFSIQLSGCSKVDENKVAAIWGSPTADEEPVFQEIPCVLSMDVVKRMERRNAAMKRANPGIPGAVVMDQNQYNQWEIDLVEMRIEKNERYFNQELSPLQADSIPTFQGLNYYFPNKELNFRAPYKVEPGTEVVKMTKRKGNIVSYVRRGKVSFRHEGKVHTLSIFGPEDTSNGDYLFLPFYDNTSGTETYGGGRYLDVEISQGFVNLDFNYSYNPLCDYNPMKYNCTLPPEENKLGFAVRAGEKTLYPLDH
jgi:uncharacterized protein